ncbi:MAG: UDP-N-acetylmuramoyl-L-alanyl-D-glutamate--2,6-diaminopimelate ligase, partial [Oscillospiraceae bacterium]
MTTEKIFNNISYTGTLPTGEVTGVTQDSRKVQKGSIFVCVKGKTSDGVTFAKTALEKGAICIVTQENQGLENEVTVKDARICYALLCANFFENPAKDLKLIALTGTNGKTTVTTVIKQILENAGFKCGLIGTIKSEIDQMELPAKYTTPEAWDLNALFARMKSAGCEYVVLEASSQALDQQRLYGLQFVCGVFTNLTQDHLDYHGTMENYFLAKAKLFPNCKKIVVNIDDEYGVRLCEMFSDKEIITYSDNKDTADYTAKNVQLSAGGVKFAMVSKGSINRVSFPMPGDFSVHNAMAAALAAISVGVNGDKVCKALEGCKGVKGRCEVLYGGKFTVICDFAHTGDGIEKILSSVKPFVKGRLIALFGCAGERDAKKRPLMSGAVVKY